MAVMPSKGDLMTGVLRHLAKGSLTNFGDPLIASALGREEHAATSPAEMDAVFKAVQELMAIGLVVQGADRLNNQWPWLGLTDRAREMLEDDGPPLHDPSGYLDHLRKVVPELDDDALLYVGEAVQAFSLNLLRAATVMIGTASEILIQRLISAWANAIDGSDGEELRKTSETKPVSVSFRKFKSSFEQNLRRIDERRFKQDTMTVIESVFHFIRLCRNDAGHAIGFAPPDRPLVQAQLVMFRQYARRLYDLIAYLGEFGLAP